MFADVYRGQTVLLTGHTGFKGSWLSSWLVELGARVVGYSLPPPTEPNHYDLLRLPIESVLGDVRDRPRLEEVIHSRQPALVFHLGAQPLVRRSYQAPEETLTTNVVGTLNVYEACRATPEVRAVVTITSDKVYENRESAAGYQESDALGGSDPYSCSKACTELLTTCYRQSFFPPADYGVRHQTLLASARAGNVIGGGDWAEDRLLPDAVKAAARREPLVIRSPRSVRPWQHVLEPLSGYLLLGQRLLQGEPACAEAWNFGPENAETVDVETVIRQFQKTWPQVETRLLGDHKEPHETKVLKLDSAKAQTRLGWRPVWNWTEAVDRTAYWYRDFYQQGVVRTRQDLTQYVADAQTRGVPWTD